MTFDFPVRIARLVLGVMAVIALATLSGQRTSVMAAGPDTFDCSNTKYGLKIDQAKSKDVTFVSSGGTMRITPVTADAVLGLDDIEAAKDNFVVVDTHSAGDKKDIFIVPRALPYTFSNPKLVLTLSTPAEVVIGGVFLLKSSQTLAIKAGGLDAIDCPHPTKGGNGRDIEGGILDFDIDALGIGTSSSPKGQVITLRTKALSLKTAENAKVCLNMEQQGNQDTIKIGDMDLGGETNIRLESAPVSITRNLSIRPKGSLLIGPNADLCKP